MNKTETGRISVTGIDGSGKSTTTRQATELLSHAYPDTPLNLVDSNGLTRYLGGEPVATKFSNLERLKAEKPGVSAKIRTGLFTVARRALETYSIADRGAITIGVRDPFRVDLAAFLPQLSDRAKRLSPEQRLALFHSLTTAPHQAQIAHLDVDPLLAYQSAAARGTLEPHETPEALATASQDLDNILAAYTLGHGVPVQRISALAPDTTSNLAEKIEPFVAKHR